MKRLIDLDIPGPKRDYVGYGRHVPQVFWPNGVRVALNFAINYEEGSEQMKHLGDPENEGLIEFPNAMPHDLRDLAVESVYEYGSRAGIWRLQRIFDELNVPATILACAVALERNPEVAAWIREAGHDVCAHGWRWEKVWKLTKEEERKHIRWAIESIKETCGERPLGWYCRYGPSVHTRELLVEEGGFLYDSDTYNDDLPYYTEVAGQQHLVLPFSQAIADGKFAKEQGYQSPSDFYDYLKRHLDFLWEEGATHPKMMSIGLHPRMIGQPTRISALKDFIEYAMQKGEVWMARRVDIANWWTKNKTQFKY